MRGPRTIGWLVAGSHPGPQSATTLLVRPEAAFAQFEADAATAEHVIVGAVTLPAATASGVAESHPPTVQIIEEVLQHLVSLADADVDIVLQIRATKPDGFDDAVVRP